MVVEFLDNFIAQGATPKKRYCLRREISPGSKGRWNGNSPGNVAPPGRCHMETGIWPGLCTAQMAKPCEALFTRFLLGVFWNFGWALQGQI